MTTHDEETQMAMPWEYDDGGRRAAGHPGDAPGDCAVRALAIAMNRNYRDVYDELFAEMKRMREVSRTKKRKAFFGGSPRSGVPREVIDTVMKKWDWVRVPLQVIGQRQKMHLRYDELPEAAMIGPVVMQVSKHMVAVVNGVVRDTHDPSREGTRMAYAYYCPRKTLAVLAKTP